MSKAKDNLTYVKDGVLTFSGRLVDHGNPGIQTEELRPSYPQKMKVHTIGDDARVVIQAVKTVISNHFGSWRQLNLKLPYDQCPSGIVVACKTSESIFKANFCAGLCGKPDHYKFGDTVEVVADVACYEMDANKGVVLKIRTCRLIQSNRVAVKVNAK